MSVNVQTIVLPATTFAAAMVRVPPESDPKLDEPSVQPADRVHPAGIVCVIAVAVLFAVTTYALELTGFVADVFSVRLAGRPLVPPLYENAPVPFTLLSVRVTVAFFVLVMVQMAP